MMTRIVQFLLPIFELKAPFLFLELGDGSTQTLDVNIGSGHENTASLSPLPKSKGFCNNIHLDKSLIQPQTKVLHLSLLRWS